MSKSLSNIQANSSVAVPGMNGRSRWVIVLAEGRNAPAHPKRRGGGSRSKPQSPAVAHCVAPSVLDLAASVAPPDHVLTVVGPGQDNCSLESRPPGALHEIVRQPDDRGSAVAIFTAMVYILERDPAATILIFPANFAVSPETRFRGCVDSVCQHLEKSYDRLAVFGAFPERAELAHGWIEHCGKKSLKAPGHPSHIPTAVKRFHEKPNREQAELLHRTGCLMNTMICIVKARTLSALGGLAQPKLMHAFNNFRMVLQAVRSGMIGKEHEKTTLANVYQKSEPTDFARDILPHLATWSVVFPLAGIEWRGTDSLMENSAA